MVERHFIWLPKTDLLWEKGVSGDPKYWKSRVPLSIATYGGQEVVFRLLMGTGRVDLERKDANGTTTLSKTVDNGHDILVKLLLANE